MLFKHLTLVDTSTIVYRSFLSQQAVKMSQYAGHPLSGPTYLLLQTLSSFAKSYPPAIYVFDGHPKVKYQKYPEYKAGRHESAEIAPGVARETVWSFINTLFASLPMAAARLDDAEADSTLATLAHRLTAEGWKVTVITKDHDLLALADIAQIVFLSHKGERINVDEKYFADHYGNIKPSQVRLYKAFFGDNSDCLPRIPKMRSQLIYDYVLANNTTLEQAWDYIHPNREKLGEQWYGALIAFWPQATINYELAELQTNLSATVEFTPGNQVALTEVLNVLAIKKLTADELHATLGPGVEGLRSHLVSSQFPVREGNNFSWMPNIEAFK